MVSEAGTEYQPRVGQVQECQKKPRDKKQNKTRKKMLVRPPYDPKPHRLMDIKEHKQHTRGKGRRKREVGKKWKQGRTSPWLYKTQD